MGSGAVVILIIKLVQCQIPHAELLRGVSRDHCTTLSHDRSVEFVFVLVW